METIIRTKEKVLVKETEEVVKEEYTVEQLAQELEAVESEIKNYGIIVENRLAYLTGRKARLAVLLTN